MPYSFTQIEKDKTKTIGLVFSFLIVFYFLMFWVIWLILLNYQFFSSSAGVLRKFQTPSLSSSFVVLISALSVGFIHWKISTNNIVGRMLDILDARPPDPGDTYHNVFKNVVEEVIVATGGRQKIEPFIVPTMAMNAFALQDFKGRAVIGVTEGVVSRLSRDQLEAVVGHEAAHILSEDCLQTTVISSIFELYSGMLYGISLMFRGSSSGSSRFGSSRSSGGSAAAVIILIYVLLLITKGLGVIIRMFISRQREYRADAVAVRLTRNPLALAEALYAIGYRWRGAGLTAENMEAIFIVNPKFSSFEEEANLFSDLFATHPPFSKRVSILLDMAHANMEVMMNNVEKRDQIPKSMAPEKSVDNSQWNVNKDGKWFGPLNITDFTALGWLRPDTWISKVGEKSVRMAHEDPLIGSIISKEGSLPASDKCPKCSGAMKSEDYEGALVQRCLFCHSIFLNEHDVKKIIIRQDYGFSDRIKRMAENLQKDILAAKIKKTYCDPKALLVCPTCHGRMLKRFYTYAYMVEVDHCMGCGKMLFDKDELEVLQCMIEQTAKKKG